MKWLVGRILNAKKEHIWAHAQIVWTCAVALASCAQHDGRAGVCTENLGVKLRHAQTEVKADLFRAVHVDCTRLDVLQAMLVAGSGGCIPSTLGLITGRVQGYGVHPPQGCLYAVRSSLNGFKRWVFYMFRNFEVFPASMALRMVCAHEKVDGRKESQEKNHTSGKPVLPEALMKEGFCCWSRAAVRASLCCSSQCRWKASAKWLLA
eukprot:1159190-Pelagomonas_calceolata.AAC.1